jgi:hypothetical protein
VSRTVSGIWSWSGEWPLAGTTSCCSAGATPVQISKLIQIASAVRLCLSRSLLFYFLSCVSANWGASEAPGLADGDDVLSRCNFGASQAAQATDIFLCASSMDKGDPAIATPDGTF